MAFQGKTVNWLIKDVVTDNSSWQTHLYQKINNGSWVEQLDSKITLADGDNVTSFVVDENATHIWARIAPVSPSVTRHIQTGEWVVYPIPSEETIFWESSDGTGLSGTYSTGSDSSYNYIYNLSSTVAFPSIPSTPFELSFKFNRPTTTTNRNLLWCIGASTTDCLLVGWDSGSASGDKNMRIYRRSGSTNTSVQNNTSPNYNNGEWNTATITYDGTNLTFTIGSTSISTTLSSVSIIQNYTTSNSKITDLKIRKL